MLIILKMARFVENITYETAGSISIGRWRRATGSNSAPWCSSRAGISRIAFTYSGRNVTLAYSIISCGGD